LEHGHRFEAAGEAVGQVVGEFSAWVVPKHEPFTSVTNFWRRA
jgi:hypothetical protein